ncbi:hypothetical protein VIGAN_01222500, partial [Vigna angularis var. angularis]
FNFLLSDFHASSFAFTPLLYTFISTSPIHFHFYLPTLILFSTSPFLSSSKVVLSSLSSSTITALVPVSSKTIVVLPLLSLQHHCRVVVAILQHHCLVVIVVFQHHRHSSIALLHRSSSQQRLSLLYSSRSRVLHMWLVTVRSCGIAFVVHLLCILD